MLEWYIELAHAKPQFNRNTFVKVTDLKGIGDFIKKHNNTGVFKTICKYDNTDLARAACKAPLVFDIDNTEIDKSLEDARWLVDKLIKEGFSEIDFRIYYSGGKGFHVEIAEEAIPVEPSMYIMDIYKKIGENFKESSPNKSIDTKIYESRRVFRIPFSKHEKSGLFKSVITLEQLNTFDIEQIKGLCKERVVLKWDKSGIVPNEGVLKHIRTIEKLLKEKKQKYASAQTINIKNVELYPCIKYFFDNPPGEGERNDTAYNLALFLKTKNVTEDDALKTLIEWGRSIGLNDHEILATVRSAYQSDYGWSCNNLDSLKKHCDKSHCPLGMLCGGSDDENAVVNFGDVIYETEEYLFGKRKVTDLTTGYSKVDHILSGLQENEFLIISGPVGSGKSLFAGHMALENARNGKRVGFLSLEMTNEQVAQRFIQQMSGVTNESIVHQNYTEEEKKKMLAAITELKDIKTLYFFSRDEIYSVDKIESVIKKMLEKYGLDILIIDHLRYISRDGKSREHEEIDKITTRLQQITQRFNVCIVLLAHFTKGDDTKPREMSELLGGNSVYREATKILQIWRKMPKDPIEEQEMSDIDKATRFIVLKNRFGTTGMCYMEFDYATQTFKETSIEKQIEQSLKKEYKQTHSELNIDDIEFPES